MAGQFKERIKAIVLLEDGAVFYGKLAGEIQGTSMGNISFNTSMTGYQEVMTDPNNRGELLVMTNAHIGNYGMCTEDDQSNQLQIGGVICKNFSEGYSRTKAETSLQKRLEEQNILAVADIDTRALTAYIRENGSMNAAISTEIQDLDNLKSKLASFSNKPEAGKASSCSSSKPYFSGDEKASYKVAVLDLGVKIEILKQLQTRDCYLQVFPWDTSYEEMSHWAADAYMVTGGSGNPENFKTTIQTVKTIIAKDRPLFGIGLGHQLIALANGMSIFKMHHGHHGINQPVLNKESGLAEITSQNHQYAVSFEELKGHPQVELTHLHLNDSSVAGMKIKDKKCFSVQYQPEAAPGPHDAHYLFANFLESFS